MFKRTLYMSMFLAAGPVFASDAMSGASDDGLDTSFDINSGGEIVYSAEELKYIERAHEEDVAREQEAIARALRKAEQAKADEERRKNPSSNTAKVDSFVVTANSCTASAKVGIKNPRLEPQPQEGMKFLVLDATFKNISNSSLYIDPGSLLINYSGRTYSYSGVELILDQQYMLPASPINPLVSYRTKLVYRIPNELSGKVRWQPGNNSDRTTVKCGSI